MESCIYFEFKDIIRYLHSLKGKFSNGDLELLVGLTVRKIFENKYEKEGFKLGILIKEEYQNIFNKPGNISLNDIGKIIKKYSKHDSLIDIILGSEKIKKPTLLQIKLFGVDKNKGGGNDELIELLIKHKFDVVTNEILIVYLDNIKGLIDHMEIYKKVNMDKFPYKEVITIHFSKPDMLTHCVRLKPIGGSNKFMYTSFTQDEIIKI